MTTGLKIKQVADAAGLTTATLRYYEQIGLLPTAERTPAGYRVYDERTLDRLAFIARAKQLGCTLEEITDLVAVWDGGRCGPVQDQLRDLVAGKIDAAQQQIAELMAFTADLQHAAATLGQHRPEGPCNDDCGCVTAPTVGSTAQPVSFGRKPASPQAPPIACTLAAGEMTGRIGEWQSLVAHVVRREAIDGGVRCVFAESVPLDELMRLVAAEQACCRFFAFAITVDVTGVALEVQAPDDASLVVSSMFGVAA